MPISPRSWCRATSRSGAGKTRERNYVGVRTLVKHLHATSGGYLLEHSTAARDEEAVGSHHTRVWLPPERKRYRASDGGLASGWGARIQGDKKHEMRFSNRMPTREGCKAWSAVTQAQTSLPGMLYLPASGHRTTFQASNVQRPYNGQRDPCHLSAFWPAQVRANWHLFGSCL